MRLRNKLTGDVIEVKGNWKDYEPEDVWYITSNGEIERGNADISWVMEKMIGNYFESKEDAEEAVKKLEAWERLKDAGFKFEGWVASNADINTIYYSIPEDEVEGDAYDDMVAIFGEIC